MAGFTAQADLKTPLPDAPEAGSSTTLLLFGAGGHARVVADAALLSAGWRRLLACDRDEARCKGELLPGVALCLPAIAERETTAGVHVSIGNNAAREREARAWGLERLVSVLHPAASVSSMAQIAAGCFVAAQAVLAPGARLGMAVIVNHGAVVDHDVTVGAFSHIAPGAVLGGGVTIGEQVLVGAGAVVLPGIRVCSGAVLGAGAVVASDIGQAGTYVGVPARKVK